MAAPDAVAIASFIRQRFDDASTPVEIGRGEWSRAYGFTANGRELVIRFGEHREDYEKDRVAAGFATRELPVPALIEVGEALGGAYAISARAHGRFLETLGRAGFRAALPSTFGALDALREIELPGEGFGPWRPDGVAPFASWRDYLLDVANDDPGSRTGGWRALLASRPGAEGAFEAGYAALERLVDACPEVRHVVHTDLVASNLLVDDAEVSAVVDWGNAIYGDFLYDLAHIAFWLPWFRDLGGIDLAAEAGAHHATIGLDVPAFEERFRCYLVRIGLDAQAYNALTHRWDELERSAARTMEFAAGV